MTAALDAFQATEQLIEQARQKGGPHLNLDTPETRALTALPESIFALENLQTLYLSNTQITDTGAAKIAGLQNLRILTLDNTQITDTGAAQIARLENLQDLYLSNTQITDTSAAKIARLENLKILTLDNTRIRDLRPLTRLTKLADKDGFDLYGLYFENTPACDLDPRIKTLSEISNGPKRTAALFDYLNSLTDWPPRAAAQTPPQRIAPIQAEIREGQLVERIPETALPDDIARRACIAWAILKDLHADASATLGKDNLPHLQRALAAFGRALGADCDSANQIALGTHGQRIIEIGKDARDMLMDDAAGELRAFAAAIALHLQRFPEWIAYLQDDPVDSSPPLTHAETELRNLSAAFGNADFIAPQLAEKFDDLLDAADDGTIPAPLAKKGVLDSLSNMLSPLAGVVLKGAKAVGKHLVLPAVQGALGTGLTVAIADLLLNNGQILLTLADKYPAALGWLQAVLTALK